VAVPRSKVKDPQHTKDSFVDRTRSLSIANGLLDSLLPLHPFTSYAFYPLSLSLYIVLTVCLLCRISYNVFYLCSLEPLVVYLSVLLLICIYILCIYLRINHQFYFPIFPRLISQPLNSVHVVTRTVTLCGSSALLVTSSTSTIHSSWSFSSPKKKLSDLGEKSFH